MVIDLRTLLARLRELQQQQAFKIVAVYAVAATAWILGSDYLVSFVVDPKRFTEYQNTKGLLFVFITSSLLYWFVHRAFRILEAADSSLLESEERFHVFMNNLPSVAFIKDSNGRYVYVNPAWTTIFGHTLRDVEGKSDEELWPKEIAEQLIQADQRVLHSGRRTTLEELIQEPDGALHRWRVYKFRFDDNGRSFLGGIAVRLETEAPPKSA